MTQYLNCCLERYGRKLPDEEEVNVSGSSTDEDMLSTDDEEERKKLIIDSNEEGRFGE